MNTFKRCLLWLMIAFAALSATQLSPLAIGKHPHACRCAHCGCPGQCCKVCRLERTEKVTPVNIWGFKCEDFCLPCPSKPNCEHCTSLYDAEAKAPPCACPKKFVWTDWVANCHAKMFTRKKLFKQVALVKTPTYKWVVEDLCPECQAACEPVKVPEGTELPPQPQVEGSVTVVAWDRSPEHEAESEAVVK